jgi:hypothetical protein
MKTEDLARFNEQYLFIKSRENDAINFYNATIEDSLKALVTNSNNRVKKQEDDSINLLPFVYRAFKISKWMVKQSSGFLCFDIPMNSIYLLLTCYQKKPERNRFIKNHSESIKIQLLNDRELSLYTWVEEFIDSDYKDGKFTKIPKGLTINKAIESNEMFLYYGYEFELSALTNDDELAKVIVKKLNKLIENNCIN